jgi:glycosyltransferase involved in cell wall biosynthesis
MPRRAQNSLTGPRLPTTPLGTLPISTGTKPRLPLTVIVPAYNRPREVARALRSILDQSAYPAEIIVVDDASNDAIEVEPTLRQQLDIRLARHQTNGGAAAARNTGLMLARTDWVTFLDSDDVWLPDSLEKRWALVEQDQRHAADDKIIYGCSWVDCDVDGTALRVRHPRGAEGPLDFAGGCWFSPGSCVILSGVRALELVGAQDETLRRYEDFDWFLSLALAGFRLRLLPVVGAKVEMKRHVDPAAAEQSVAAIRRKWLPKLRDRAMRNRMLSYLDLELASAWHYRGAWQRTLPLLARSLLRMPRLSLHTSAGWTFSDPRSLSEYR